MTSLFAQLYLSIQAQIKIKVPEILWIDQDMGQLELYETRPAVVWPCALIDFPATQYSNEGQLVQWAMVQINIRLGFAPFGSANSEAPQLTKEQALDYYEIENKLVKALHGFTANDAVQPLVRQSTATERRDDAYRVREIIFTTATEDTETMLPANTILSGLQIDQI